MSEIPPIRSYLFSFGDLLHLLKQKKKPILLATISFALIASFYTLSKPPKYLAAAKFREMGRRDSESSSMTKLLLKSSDDKTGQAIRTMQSRLVTSKVLEKLGMQAVLSEPGFLPSALYNSFQNLRIQIAHLLRSETLSLPEPIALQATNVNYPGEVRSYYKLRFISDTDYEILSGNTHLANGSLEIPVSGKGFTLTLKKRADQPLKGRIFNLTLMPLQKTALHLAKEIKATDDDEDITLVKLSYPNVDKNASENTLNSLMESYQEYLSSESVRQGELQLKFLQKRQEELFVKQEALMQEHARDHVGAASATKEIEFITNAKVQALEKIHSLDGQIRYLESYQGVSAPLSSLKKGFDEIAKLKLELTALSAIAKNTNFIPEQFPGLNLETAKELHLSNLRNAQEMNYEIKKLEFILEQLQSESFELGSLSTSLKDPLCQEIIAKAGKIALRLKDEKNYAPKEVERLNAELKTQRRFLQTHLGQMRSLEEINLNLLNQKNAALIEVLLSLSKERLNHLEAHVNEALFSEVDSLKTQKEQIVAYDDELTANLSSLPNKWISEQLIEQNLALSRASFEELTKLTEGKNVSSNLNLVVSHPIDKAYAPPLPKSPNLLIFGPLGAFIGAFFSILYFAVIALFKGVEATAENVRLFTTKVAGKLQTFRTSQTHPSNSDLSSLREVLTLSKENKRISLLTGKGPNIAKILAKLFTEKGESVLVIDDSKLNSRFLPEYLASSAFTEKLDAPYDRILWSAPYSVASSEGQLSATHANFTVALIEDEQLLSLENALEKAENGRLCFLFYSA